MKFLRQSSNQAARIAKLALNHIEDFYLRKTFFFLIFTLFSMPSFALVPYIATDRECSHRLPLDNFVIRDSIFSGENFEIDTELSMRKMQQELSSLVDYFKGHGDRKLRSRSKVCLGIFEGRDSNRAYANRYYAIAMGANLLRNLQENYQFGDDVFYVVLFHEFAHAVQAKHDLHLHSGASLFDQKISELQADCASATFARIQSRYHEGAFEEFARRFRARSPNTGYGTHQQRFAAMRMGSQGFDQLRSQRVRIDSDSILNGICSRRAIIDNLENGHVD